MLWVWRRFHCYPFQQRSIIKVRLLNIVSLTEELGKKCLNNVFFKKLSFLNGTSVHAFFPFIKHKSVKNGTLSPITIKKLQKTDNFFLKKLNFQNDTLVQAFFPFIKYKTIRNGTLSPLAMKKLQKTCLLRIKNFFMQKVNII